MYHELTEKYSKGVEKIGGLDTIFKLSVIMNMVDQITRPSQAIDQSLDKTTQKIQDMQQKAGNLTKTGLALTSFGADITKAVLSPVAATFETKAALGELASVGVEDFEALERAATAFSDKWSKTSKADFIAAAYDIKSGISSLSDEGVAAYTEVAALTAKATKASVAEMTSLFASGYGIYKDYYKDLSDIEFAEMFSAGIARSVKQFKTDGSKMTQAISTLGASATSANVPLEEQLSILGMLQATMGGGEAGTKYKAFLKSAAKAGKELNLQLVDANNQLLSMPEILNKLRNKFGDTLDASEKLQLQKAFGTEEAVALIDLLYNKTNDLESNILGMYGSLNEGTKVAIEMAEAMNQDPGSRYQILTQQVHNLKEKLGNQLLPTVVKGMQIGSDFIGKVSSWADENENLAGLIMKVALFLGILITTVGAGATTLGVLGIMFAKVGLGVSSFVRIVKGIPGALDTVILKSMYAGDHIKLFAKNLASGIGSIKQFGINLVQMGKQAIVSAVVSLKGLIASVWSFTAALLANPITWIVIGIMALIAVVILLWKNWDKVSAALAASWQWLRELGVRFAEGVQNSLKSLVTTLLTLDDRIRAVFINLIKAAANWGANLIKGFIDGILGKAAKVGEAAGNVMKTVKKFLGFNSPSEEGEGRYITLWGHNMVAGFVDGISKSSGIVSSAVSNLIKKPGLEFDIMANVGAGGAALRMPGRYFDKYDEKNNGHTFSREKEIRQYRDTLREEVKSEKKETMKQGARIIKINKFELHTDKINSFEDFVKQLYDAVTSDTEDEEDDL